MSDAPRTDAMTSRGSRYASRDQIGNVVQGELRQQLIRQLLYQSFEVGKGPRTECWLCSHADTIMSDSVDTTHIAKFKLE